MSEIKRYNPISIVLHWSLALFLIAQLSIGFWMIGIPKDPPGIRAEWFNIHKSIGISLAILIVFRIIWRLKNEVPELPEGFKNYQKQIAIWNHRALYLCMVLMPLSGFLGSSFTAYPIKFFGITLPRLFEASATLKEFFSLIHSCVGFTLTSLIFIHLSAALLHFLKRDGVLMRMTPLIGNTATKQ
jgi:cytochrome b561